VPLVLLFATGCSRTGGVDQRSADLAKLEEQVGALSAKVDELRPMVTERDDGAPQFHTTKEAQQIVAKLGTSPTAENLAKALGQLDEWLVKPEEEAAFTEFKRSQLSVLRKQIEKELHDLHTQALNAPNGEEAATIDMRAGQLLSLFPMGTEPATIVLAQKLSREHANVGTRLQSIQRQRYNQWATNRIEAAIDGYNKNASYRHPIDENPKLIESLVDNLKEVDPLLLEPVVLDLYNYVIDLTRKSVSENDSVNMAKRLSSADNKRKSLGDF